MATALQTLSAAELAGVEVDRFIASNQRKSLLRFITCGSVDDGKSTLIGRLLYDSRQLLDDQIDALRRESGVRGVDGDDLDLSLLVDGLAAEREQGITIDVAYRFFATARRKFIVADTPGHEQYTRNMATGASTAELAVVLVDARKGVLQQTRRHSHLVRLLGIERLVLAVNKMDLVAFDESVFNRIVADYRTFADAAGIKDFTAIPLSGRSGDNVMHRSVAMPWYEGPTLLEHLELVETGERPSVPAPFRMSVQWVNRAGQDFRGYAGLIASGELSLGDSITSLPGGHSATIDSILTARGASNIAVAGEAVTLTFAEAIDCSRGDLLTAASSSPVLTDQLAATLVWMDSSALVPGGDYWLKVGARMVTARISRVVQLLDIGGDDPLPGRPLVLNDIGEVEITLDREIPLIRYAENRRLGGFVLIDKSSNATVAAGMVRGVPVAAAEGGRTARQRELLWIAAPSAEERTAYAQSLKSAWAAIGHSCLILDEEALADLDRDLPSDAGPERMRRLRSVATLIHNAGVDVLITADVQGADAHPGRRIEAGDGSAIPNDWVI